MRKLRYQRRQSRSAVWASRFGLLATLLLTASFVFHRFSTLETPDLVIAAAICFLLAVLGLICALRGLRNLWVHGDKGGMRSSAAVLLALIVLVPLLAFGTFWLRSPPFYDVSTDLETPPQFPANMPQRLSFMNPLTPRVSGDALTQFIIYPDVIGRRYEAAPDRVAEGVANVLKDFGWQVITSDVAEQEAGTLSFVATAHSFILGLKSDIIIRLLDEGETTYVDMRSLSRYGTRDMGQNAALITEFLGALEGEVNKAPADVE
ncbi:DUF1499 domain-containing protein [Brucella sp. BE17]|uniref:DUF1499 domain-containing protein n=1 Tax=Brucella sp. BE17 TaxID=3142977 RepID=UPI0031B9E59A